MALLNPDTALRIILDSVQTLDCERARLHECLGRVLAEDVRSDIDIPPFDNSAMDGYAVIADDIGGASRENPAKLNVIAEQPAGASTAPAVCSGNAVRIMTGAPIPGGADAVVIVEDTERDGGEVAILREAFFGANIRRAGEDVKSGQVALRKGTVIRPAEMGMLASVGVIEPLVHKKPNVAIITTGDELVDASEKPGPGQIRNSNQFSLLGEALQAGCGVTILQQTRDDRAEIESALKRAAEICDLLIICGGVSVGDHDYVKDILGRLGEIRFWKTAIKPGMPLVFGDIGGKPVFGLPGNPVSCIVCFDIYMRPAVRRMMGDESGGLSRVTGVLTGDIRHKPGRREFVRAVTTHSSLPCEGRAGERTSSSLPCEGRAGERTSSSLPCEGRAGERTSSSLPSQGRVGERSDGGYVAKPIPKHGSGMLSSMVEANSYVVVGEDSGDVREGDRVEIVLFRV